MARAGLGPAHVGGLPAELIQNLPDDLLGILVVAADEHRRFPGLEFGIHHQTGPHGIERLDEVVRGELPLQAFHKRFIDIAEEFQHAIHRRGVGDGIRQASITVLSARWPPRRPVSARRARPRRRPRGRRLRRTRPPRRSRRPCAPWCLAAQSFSLRRLARADRHLVAVFEKARARESARPRPSR